MHLYILVGLLVVSVNADTNITSVGARKISQGWDSCPYNSNLRMRCSSDCENLEYCLNGRVITISCLEQTGQRYCNSETSTCADEIDRCYNRRDMCPHDGTFPDIRNCHRYVNCEGDNVNIYQCNYGTVWNYKTGTCEDEDISGSLVNSTEKICQTYTKDTGCSGANSNAIVPHINPRWFVFCNFGRSFLAECPGKTYTFDKKRGNCRFQCEHQGNIRNGFFADERDSTTYYKCHKIGGVWKTDEKKCPPDSYFVQARQICVRNLNTTTWRTTTTTEWITTEALL